MPLLSLSVENNTESLEEWHGMFDHPHASADSLLYRAFSFNDEPQA
jgi:hypothetical protein